MRSLLIVVLGTVLLSGCISNAFQTQVNDSYTLIDNINPSVLNSDIDLNVEVEAPLNRGSIVVKISDVSLRVTNNHKWSQKLEDQLRLLAINEFFKYRSLSKFKYEIKVLKFYGSTDGRVFVSLVCKVQDGDKLVSNQAYVQELIQSEDGYDALLASLKDGYLNLINKIILDIK